MAGLADKIVSAPAEWALYHEIVLTWITAPQLLCAPRILPIE